MLWEVKGADRSSGIDVHTEVEAGTEAEAVKIAGKAMFITSVWRKKPVPPPQAPAMLPISALAPVNAPGSTPTRSNTPGTR